MMKGAFTVRVGGLCATNLRAKPSVRLNPLPGENIQCMFSCRCVVCVLQGKQTAAAPATRTIYGGISNHTAGWSV